MVETCREQTKLTYLIDGRRLGTFDGVEVGIDDGLMEKIGRKSTM